MSDDKNWKIVYGSVNLLILGCLWLFFSLPIVTIGASSKALHECCRNLSQNGWQSDHLIRSFLCSFKAGFVISLKTWLIMLAGFLLIYNAVQYQLHTMGKMYRENILILLVVLILLFYESVMLGIYLACFRPTKVFEALRGAFAVGCSAPGLSASIVAIIFLGFAASFAAIEFSIAFIGITAFLVWKLIPVMLKNSHF